MKEIAIIGGGAAGIAAALTAARENPAAHITILERLDRVGKKLLATGNGHCNLTNEDMTVNAYHSTQPKQLAEYLAQMPTERTVEFFRSLGLLCMTDDAGRVYPYCRQASMVLDVLLLALQSAKNIDIITNCRVTAIQKQGKGFTVSTDAGQRFRAGAVIVTTGGKAAPKQGTDGAGYPLIEPFGHHCTKLFPCLTGLQCKGNVFKGLKGIRVLGTVSLYHGKKKLATERGELQFTEYGVSGIPAFQLSCRLTGQDELSIDFFPDWSYNDLKQELKQRLNSHPDWTLENALLGLLHKRVQFALLKQLNLSATAPAGGLSKGDLDSMVAIFKQWRVTVTGTQGWDSAQVTGGGIPLSEINADFSSRLCAGLYLAGEMLDVVGDCGGYNLHWAWCSGGTAGAAAAR